MMAKDVSAHYESAGPAHRRLETKCCGPNLHLCIVPGCPTALGNQTSEQPVSTNRAVNNNTGQRALMPVVNVAKHKLGIWLHALCPDSALCRAPSSPP
eukprot:COSAG02_NODE_5772_length_4050_cov_1.758542_2_plen_98_part_00